MNSTSPSINRSQRLDVAVEVEQVGGVVYALDLREPVVLRRAVDAAEPILPELHGAVDVSATSTDGVRPEGVPEVAHPGPVRGEQRRVRCHGDDERLVA